MSNRALTNITLFIVGNASQAVPSKGFMSYGVISGKAEKPHQIYDIPDIDDTKTVQELWDESVAQIKANEGIV